MPEVPFADIEVEEQQEIEVKEPNLWKVIMLNDDKTTMDFVVGILIHVFHKSESEAIEVMLRIHLEGQAVVGVYPYEVAEEKMNTTIHTARASNFPLTAIIEEDV